MDPEVSQAVNVKCKQHPSTQIGFIYCKSKCPYPYRLACIQCVKEYKTLEGFEELQEVLKDPRLILNSKDRSEFGIYNLLNEYFDLLEQNYDQFIQFFKKGIFRQIEQLEHDLKEGIEKFNKFRTEIAKVHKQFNEILGHQQLKQAFQDILKVESYLYGPEWYKLEETVQNYVLQFTEQNNQELQEAYSKIKEMDEEFIQSHIVSDFQRKTFQSVEQLCRQVSNFWMFSQVTKLCDNLYFSELIHRTKIGRPKITLLFRATEHGMSAQSFWSKCSNQGPTITVCKSKNGYVFGGYSPCKWIPQVGAYQKDDSKTSFLFSYTLKEIYPIIQVDNAIFCNQGANYGPTFGAGHNLYIGADFQSGGSNMEGNNYSNQSYKIMNATTHLMGAATPQLVEMEVFLIE